MTHLSRLCLVWCLGSALVSTAAQRRWIVDAAGGPGHDFTDLPPALAAAHHGDFIELRAGSYRGATTDRGVTILGTASARLTTTLRVTALPLGRAFALVGVACDGAPFGGPAIECTDDAGRIHLDRVRVTGVPSGFFQPPGAGLLVARCRALTVTGGVFTGAPPLSVQASSVVVVGATLTGRNAEGSTYEFFWLAQPGLHLMLSNAFVSRCRLQGGAAGMHFTRPLPAEPGLRASDSDIVFAGGAGEACNAGAPWGAAPGASAVVAERGTLLLDPTLPLGPTGGMPPISGTAAVTSRRVPALLATGAPIGQLVAADLYAPAGHATASCLDLVREPLPTAFGELWLDPTRWIVVDLGPMGAGEHRSFSVGVPNQSALVGLLPALQGLTLDPGPARVALTNPVVFGVY